MTCIVGLAHEGEVFIGGDSAATAGHTQIVMAGEKVFRNGPMLIGTCGSIRAMNLLRYSLSIPDQPSSLTDNAYMCTTFIDAVRRCFKEGGYAMTDSDGQEKGSTFLVGYRSHLYCIEHDYNVTQSRDNYDAIGSGCDLAKGALYVTDGPPRERIRKALKAAAHVNVTVRAPFVIKSI